MSTKQRACAEVALASGGLALGISEFAPMTTLPSIAAGIATPLSSAGHIISAYALGVVVGAPAIAILFARVPRRTLLLRLVVVMVIANMVSALSLNFGQLLAARFAAGLPHGAYFGIAALIAASLAEPNKRGQAVGRVMLGLTIANVIGVPLATWLSARFGWRADFHLVALIAGCGLFGCWLFVPQVPARRASSRDELQVFQRPQVWLTLTVVAIGFGGLFAVYTYVTPTLLTVTKVCPSQLPFLVGLVGVGMTAGSLVGGWFADKSPNGTILGVLIWNAAVLPVFSVAATSEWTAGICLLAMGAGAAAFPAVQTRLMDVAGDAQAVSAALLHSAYNLANALGAWAGGTVIAFGWGVSATGWVGTCLATSGIAILGLSMIYDRHLAHRNRTRSVMERDTVTSTRLNVVEDLVQ